MKRRGLIMIAVSTIVAVCLTGLIIRSYVWVATAQRRYTDIATMPPRRVALVFGAGLDPGGIPSAMLADRIDAAASLYRSHSVSKLLFSGDNSRPDYDEVTAMLKYAVARGVPASVITLDYAGFDTYDSCYRARAIFGVRSAVLVTQAYHLPRAVYICMGLGVDAVGLGTTDWGKYDDRMMIDYEIRETAADAKALWDVHFSHRTPAYLGDFVGIR